MQAEEREDRLLLSRAQGFWQGSARNRVEIEMFEREWGEEGGIELFGFIRERGKEWDVGASSGTPYDGAEDQLAHLEEVVRHNLVGKGYAERDTFAKNRRQVDPR